MTVDDDRVRVTALTFADGDETGDHRHEYDYLVVPVTGGTFTVIERDGSTRELAQEAGRALSRQGRHGAQRHQREWPELPRSWRSS